jgi:hypothetical protein
MAERVLGWLRGPQRTARLPVVAGKVRRGGGLPDPSRAVEVVDWGRSGPNYMLTLNALRVLKGAGGISIALSAHP